MKPKTTLTIADAENPEDRIILTAKQAKKFRTTILENYEREGKDPSALSRRNPVFINARSAVRVLNESDFWEREFDSEQKYWIVVWLARMLKGARMSYANPRPAYVEVF
jgi:hypothetical protein